MPGAVEGLDLSGLVKKLEAMASRSVRLDLSQPLAVAGQLLVSDARQCFAQGRDPAGRPWAPLKNPSKKRGGPSAKPLRHTGRLMGSITSGVSGNRVAVGTNVFYAPYQNFGTRRTIKGVRIGPRGKSRDIQVQHISARPFLGVSVTTRRRIEDLIARAAAAQLRGA